MAAEAEPLLAASRRSSAAKWAVRAGAVGAAALGLLAYAAPARRVAAGAALDANDVDSAVSRARVLERYLLKEYPLAVCNDGSPAAYYFYPSPSGSKEKWVVMFEGGGACVSKAACDEEGRFDTSTTVAPYLAVSEGSFLNDAESPVIGDANVVYAKYCSSDAWIGDRAASDETGARHLRGSRIVDALFDDLEARHGLGSGGSGTTLVLAGSSAGGRGVFQHADRLADRVEAISGGGRTVAVIDSSMYLDLPLPADAPLEQYGTSPGDSVSWTESYAREQLAFANGYVAPACAAAFPGDQTWRCYNGEDALPTVRTPFALFQSLDDSFLLQHVSNINQFVIEDADPDAYANRVVPRQKFVRDRLTQAQEDGSAVVHARYMAAFSRLPAASSAVYAPSCLMHELLLVGHLVKADSEEPVMLGSYRNLDVAGGDSFAAFFDSFATAALAGTDLPTSVVDACAGFGCGSGCLATKRGLVADALEDAKYGVVYINPNH